MSVFQRPDLRDVVDAAVITAFCAAVYWGWPLLVSLAGLK